MSVPSGASRMLLHFTLLFNALGGNGQDEPTGRDSFQRHLRIKDVGVDIVVQDWDDAQTYPEKVLVKMPSSFAVEHKSEQIQAAQKVCELPITPDPKSVEDRGEISLCHIEVTKPPRAGYDKKDGKYVIYIEGVVHNKPMTIELDTFYDKTDLGKRLFVSHFTTLFNLYHEKRGNKDVAIPPVSLRWLMEAGKPWWNQKLEKIDLSRAGLSIELEEGVSGLGKKKERLEVDWYSAHEETLGVRSSAKEGGQVHEITKLHVLANACYDSAGDGKESVSRSFGTFATTRNITFAIVHRKEGSSMTCRESMEILSPFAMLHEDIISSVGTKVMSFVKKAEEVGMLASAFRRAGDRKPDDTFKTYMTVPAKAPMAKELIELKSTPKREKGHECHILPDGIIDTKLFPRNPNRIQAKPGTWKEVDHKDGKTTRRFNGVVIVTYGEHVVEQEVRIDLEGNDQEQLDQLRRVLLTNAYATKDDNDNVDSEDTDRMNTLRELPGGVLDEEEGGESAVVKGHNSDIINDGHEEIRDHSTTIAREELAEDEDGNEDDDDTTITVLQGDTEELTDEEKEVVLDPEEEEEKPQCEVKADGASCQMTSQRDEEMVEEKDDEGLGPDLDIDETFQDDEQEPITIIIPKDAYIPTELRYHGDVPLINDNVGAKLMKNGDLKCKKLWKKSKSKPTRVNVKGGNWMVVGNVASGSIMVDFAHIEKTYAIEAQIKFKKEDRYDSLPQDVLAILGVTELDSFPDLDDRYSGKLYNVMMELDLHQRIPKILTDKRMDPHAHRGAILREDGLIETHLFPKTDGKNSQLVYPEVKSIEGTWTYQGSRAKGKVQVHYGDAQPLVDVELQFANDEVPDDAIAFLGMEKKTFLQRAARKTDEVLGIRKPPPPRVLGIDQNKKFMGKKNKVLVTIAKTTPKIPKALLLKLKNELGIDEPKRGLEMEGWLREDGTILSNVFAPLKKDKVFYAKIVKGTWTVKGKRQAWGKVHVLYKEGIAPLRMDVQLKFFENIPNSAFRALELQDKQSLWGRIKSRNGALETSRKK
ncbi:hypothetical protein FOL47_003217 [Perkinsus chesapeaki]|uniref:Uncharacterized protein n=1 Tax=Perkinsus chesapeaki TaxID=330153 RepID=A0A7J6M9V6_PERCH|nr:hypothetical protein FOL47_003217 [Perkinsus chesapeaki]